MTDTFAFSSNVQVVRFRQSLKQRFAMVSTEEGRQIERSDGQLPKANSHRKESRPPGSKVKLERAAQYPKQPTEIDSVDAGMQID
jgi:hypothetical protein